MKFKESLDAHIELKRDRERTMSKNDRAEKTYIFGEDPYSFVNIGQEYVTYDKIKSQNEEKKLFAEWDKRM